MVLTKQYEKQSRKTIALFPCCCRKMYAYNPVAPEDYNQTCLPCEKRKKEKDKEQLAQLVRRKEKEEDERLNPEKYWIPPEGFYEQYFI